MANQIGVIIPAAGSGTRLGGVSKPLIEIDGRPAIIRLLALFSGLREVSRICVAVPKGNIQQYSDVIMTEFPDNVDIVEGGTERPYSVRNAYHFLSSRISEDDLVCIHDAARPLLAKGDLERVINEAWKSGAAFLASRLKDTLKVADDDNFCVSTIDRSRVFGAQTPQVMKSAFLKRAYFEIENLSGLTDEIMLMERIGVKARIVESQHPNFKVTTADDLQLLKKLIS